MPTPIEMNKGYRQMPRNNKKATGFNETSQYKDGLR